MADGTERAGGTVKAALVDHPPRRLAGMAWEGTYAEAADGAVRRLIEELCRRLDGRPETLWGVSWEDRPDGFRHFAGIEAAEAVPGLERLDLPALTSLTADHTGGDATGVYGALQALRDRRGMARRPGGPDMLDEHRRDGSPPMRAHLVVAEQNG
ncbi:GyrI-like domain-containing protein [Pelagerythrobacter marensis]|uniref:GyrI-like domain-containing protein n=1 Tax=Pelagerythrobacter marensis TaxID=543877 RepID=A0ABZ2D696_9SPHN